MFFKTDLDRSKQRLLCIIISLLFGGEILGLHLYHHQQTHEVKHLQHTIAQLKTNLRHTTTAKQNQAVKAQIQNLESKVKAIVK